MREIRLYGSEGGVAFGPSLPLSRFPESWRTGCSYLQRVFEKWDFGPLLAASRRQGHFNSGRQEPQKPGHQAILRDSFQGNDAPAR